MCDWEGMLRNTSAINGTAYDFIETLLVPLLSPSILPPLVPKSRIFRGNWLSKGESRGQYIGGRGTKSGGAHHDNLVKFHVDLRRSALIRKATIAQEGLKKQTTHSKEAQT